MDIKKVIFIFGKAREYAKAIGRSDFIISNWKAGGAVPPSDIKKTRTALTKHKKKLDKAYNEVMK